MLGAGSVPVTIEVRGKFASSLHRLVAKGLPELLGVLREAGTWLPRHVVKELEAFLGCGDPKLGFAWLVCEGCDHHRLDPFSCEGTRRQGG